MPTFWLLDQDGNDFGRFGTNAHIWIPGDRVPYGPSDALRVVEAVPTAYRNDFDGYLIIEPA